MIEVILIFFHDFGLRMGRHFF